MIIKTIKKLETAIEVIITNYMNFNFVAAEETEAITMLIIVIEVMLIKVVIMIIKKKGQFREIFMKLLFLLFSQILRGLNSL